MSSLMSLVEQIEDWDVEDVILLLRFGCEESEMYLEDDDFTILNQMNITGKEFLNITPCVLEFNGLGQYRAEEIVSFVNELKQEKIKWDDIITKYDLKNKRLEHLPQFHPVPYKLDDDDEYLNSLMSSMKLTLSVLRIGKTPNERARSELISPILQAVVLIGRRLTKKCIFIRPVSRRFSYNICRFEYTISISESNFNGNRKILRGSVGRQDLLPAWILNLINLEDTFKPNESDYIYGFVTNAYDWQFLVYTRSGIFCSQENFHISLDEDALKDLSTLKNDLKKITEIIVGFLVQGTYVKKFYPQSFAQRDQM
ncbi:hypothetical protein Glove_81g63 [Diversispora epigaea]|uniref:Uncharacterized protein n=1 Tax=Diversispora epigaea TaxID=1348612 RepID=A0A397J814_9GLOM|nr:hypothetical protein Glove_81g63 [Diversispora epigaea]